MSMMRFKRFTKREVLKELGREGDGTRARFIHVLQNPEPGCVSAIVLPERAHGGWN